MQVADVTARLREIAPEVHQTTHRSTGRRGQLAKQTHGMCDLMTTLAIKKLRLQCVQTTTFIGIDIPRRTIADKATHASHTLGVVHGFTQDEDQHKAIIFDFACAQYGYNEEVLITVVDKEDVYHTLRRTYGGGIWQPGGCWLSQIDTDQFLALYQSL